MSPSDDDNISSSDIYKAMHEHNKARKIRNLEAAQRIGDTFTKHTDYHWSITLQGERLDYWPSTNKWRWRSKNYTGDQQSVINFIKKRSDDR